MGGRNPGRPSGDGGDNVGVDRPLSLGERRVNHVRQAAWLSSPYPARDQKPPAGTDRSHCADTERKGLKSDPRLQIARPTLASGGEWCREKRGRRKNHQTKQANKTFHTEGHPGAPFLSFFITHEYEHRSYTPNHSPSVTVYRVCIFTASQLPLLYQALIS